MNEKDRILQRENLLAMKLSAARSICDDFPEISKIDIDVEVEFISGVGISVNREYHYTLKPYDKLYLHIFCPNVSCTSFGFELTDVIREAIRDRSSERFGEMQCDGKEDWKYIRSSGCTCQTTLRYAVFPQYQQQIDSV